MSNPSHHLLWANLGLLVLAREESGTRHGGNGWAGSHGRAESSGPREGAEETGVHGGLSGVVRVSALLLGSNWREGAFGRGIDALDDVYRARGDEQ